MHFSMGIHIYLVCSKWFSQATVLCPMRHCASPRVKRVERPFYFSAGFILRQCGVVREERLL